MKFAEFSTYLEKLEATASRLEITKTLSELLEELNPSEIAEGVFLSLGTLGPSYERVEFGISEKLMIKIMARAFSITGEEVTKLFKSEGDLGSVAQNLSSKLKTQSSKLTVGEVYGKLKEMAEAAGEGSVKQKVNLGATLLQSLDSLSARFVVRIPLGTMRLGFSEKTVLEALALLESGEKEVSFAKGSRSREIKAALEAKYNVFPNIGEIAKAFRAKGPKGLREVRMKVGVPILSQLCARLTTAEEMIGKAGGVGGEVAAEYKYDGVRLQVHMDRESRINPSTLLRTGNQELRQSQISIFDPQSSNEKVKMYTRNLEQMQAMFPDLTEEFLKSVGAKEVILDGEAVGVDFKTGKFIPFQETMQRKRKYHIEETAKKIPVKYFAFDILFKDGKDLTSLSYFKRREILLQTIKKNEKIKVTDDFVTGNAQELTDYFKEAKDKGLEGLVIKNVDSPYEAGSRGFSWVKFKREETGELSDTLDCVVLGYYKGTGKRADFGIGAFLVGIFDEKNDKFLTIAKVGTGLTDEEWRGLKLKAQNSKLKTLPKDVDIPKDLIPDVVCEPKIVVVVRSDEISLSPIHTSGYALRFPRMMGYRDDKKPEQATSLPEVKNMYRLKGKK